MMINMIFSGLVCFLSKKRVRQHLCEKRVISRVQQKRSRRGQTDWRKAKHNTIQRPTLYLNLAQPRPW